MPDAEDFFDEIDLNRSRRARELSEVKRRFSSTDDLYRINSKAVVVLTYAQWEGFYNDCVRSYLKFLKANGGRTRDRDWMMLVGCLSVEFQSLYDRNHSYDARREFVKSLQQVIDCGYDIFVADTVEARSNLDFRKLRDNYEILNFNIARFQPFRLKIDLEVVAWRHGVAHGDQPDLSKLDIQRHVDLVSVLLLMLADQFQEAMLTRIF